MMRLGPSLALCMLAVSAPVQAAPVGTLEVQAPDTLHVDDHVSLVATLRLPDSGAPLLLLTPSSQGSALEVVRGRLLRADAREPTATPLVFDLPVAAHEPGSAVVRVHVATFDCRGEVCVPLEIVAQRTVLVLPR
jgi:hypothetical protein